MYAGKRAGADSCHTITWPALELLETHVTWGLGHFRADYYLYFGAKYTLSIMCKALPIAALFGLVSTTLDT